MSTIKTNQLAHTANGASVYTLPQTDGSAGQVLKTDGSGNLAFTETPADGSITAAKLASGVNAITMVDAWGTSGGSNYSNNNFITNNWVRRTGLHGGNVGSAMTESSGTFTFPSNGLYYISWQFGGYAYAGTLNYAAARLYLSTDSGANFSEVSSAYTSAQHQQYFRIVGQELLDVTHASLFRVKFRTENNDDMSIQGGQGRTNLLFVRYGDT